MSKIWRVFAGIVLSIALTNAARADVSWAFFETGLFYDNFDQPNRGQPVAGFTPGLEAYLTVSDAALQRGSISFAEPGLVCGVTSGDTDFNLVLNLGIFFGLPVPASLSFGCARILDRLTFAGHELSGRVVESFDDIGGDNLDMTITDNVASGRLGSDGFLMGCDFGECTFTGSGFSVFQSRRLARS